MAYSVSPHLNILCTSSVKRYYTKITVIYWWCSIFMYVSLKIRNYKI